MPLEQLDLAMTASASMTPFDTFAPDVVEVLVPVPQIWFEPDLLKVEAVSPQFQKRSTRSTPRSTKACSDVRTCVENTERWSKA